MLRVLSCLTAGLISVSLVWSPATLFAQQGGQGGPWQTYGTENGEWPVYHGNLAPHHYSKATGAEVGAVYMPTRQTGSPMTYRVDGVQYLVVAISGRGYAGELLAFRLPE